MPASADDDVVVHGSPQRLGDADDGFRHLDVGLRRRGIALRVIVHGTAVAAMMLSTLTVEEVTGDANGGLQSVTVGDHHFASQTLLQRVGWSRAQVGLALDEDSLLINLRPRHGPSAMSGCGIKLPLVCLT